MKSTKRPAIVLKLSGEAMSGHGLTIDPYAFETVADQTRQLARAGYRVGIVVGGGNIHRGGRPWGAHGLPQRDGDEIGMLATALNATALERQLRHLDGQLRVTIVAKPGVARPLFRAWRRRLGWSISMHDVVIVAGGTGVGGVSTDVAAPLLAQDMGTKQIVMSKFGVDGIYSHDPRTSPVEARRLVEVTVDDALRYGLKFMDREAMELCRSLKMTVHVVPADDPTAFTRLVLDGAHPGSVMTPVFPVPRQSRVMTRPGA